MTQHRLPRAGRVRAGASAFALVAVGLLTGCGGDETATDPAGGSTQSPPAQSGSASPDEDGSTADPSAPAATRSAENITLKAPAEGAHVTGSFVASGRANSPEANVPWEVRDEAGAVILQGFATAEGWMDKLYPWKTKVDVSALEAGTYTFVAMTDDPSGGEGAPAQEVSTTIVVG